MNNTRVIFFESFISFGCQFTCFIRLFFKTIILFLHINIFFNQTVYMTIEEAM